MIEVTIKIRFKSLKNLEERVNPFDLAEALGNILDVNCGEKWNIHGDAIFERVSFEVKKARTLK